jgi:hypothetical protein
MSYMPGFKPHHQTLTVLSLATTAAAAAAAAAAVREAHQQDVSDYKDRLGKANERISEVEEAYEDLR